MGKFYGAISMMKEGQQIYFGRIAPPFELPRKAMYLGYGNRTYESFIIDGEDLPFRNDCAWFDLYETEKEFYEDAKSYYERKKYSIQLEIDGIDFILNMIEEQTNEK